MRLHHLNYRPDIDGLRALAVLGVVAFHFSPHRLPGGFIGVDVFFVISGYLISLIVFTSLDRGSFSLREFYARRLRRIFPALLITLILVGIVGHLVLFPHELANLAKHGMAGAAFFANFVFWLELGYFDTSAYEKPLLHLWSLAIEEQFYVFWPLLLLFLWRARSHVLLVLVVFTLVSFAANVGHVVNGQTDAAFYAPWARFWELSTGAIIAHLHFRNRGTPHRLPPRVNDGLSLLGAGLILYGFLTFDETLGFPGFFALVPVLGASCSIVAGRDALVNRALLSWPPLVLVGRISFPLYLLHWPVIAFLVILDGDGAVGTVTREHRVIGLVACFTLAYLIYRYVETPIRQGAPPARPVGHPAVLSLAMGTMFVLGLGGWASGGLPHRITVQPAAGASLFAGNPHPQHNENCTTVYPAAAAFWACVLSRPQAADTVLLGDSHANHYFSSLAAALPERTLLHLGEPRCFPFVAEAHAANPACRQAQARLQTFIATETSVRRYVINGYFSYLSAGGWWVSHLQQRQAAVLTDDQRDSFVAAGVTFLRGLIDAGKDVYLVLDTPDLILRPTACLTVQPGFVGRLRARPNDGLVRTERGCGIDRATYEARIAPYRAALHAIVAELPAVRVFDPVPLLCDDELCWIIRDGVPLYWDSDHLSVAGADLIINALVERFPELATAVDPL